MRFRQFISAFFTSMLIGLAAISVYSQELSTQESVRLVESVEVQGNRRISDEDISYYLKTRPQQTFNRQQTERDLQSILTLGFFDPRATRLLVEDGASGGVIVIFEVTEFPIIRTIKFEGLQSVTEEDVRNALKTKRSGISDESVANPERLRRAKVIIKELLTERGLSRAAVEIREEVESPTVVKIRFVITELP